MVFSLSCRSRHNSLFLSALRYQIIAQKDNKISSGMFVIPATSPIDITKTTKFMNRGTRLVKTNIESILLTTMR
jgi:hypothetical protein